MNKEEWKDIKGYEGIYLVSDKGNIKRKGINKNRKFNISRCGYAMVTLYKNGIVKNILVHRIVAQAFLPNFNNLPQVNHIDGNKLNNNIENLEWCTAKDNILHTYKELNRIGKSPMKGKFGSKNPKAKKVKQFDLNGNLIKIWESQIEARKTLKIANGDISKCCNGKRKTAGGFIWKYIV